MSILNRIHNLIAAMPYGLEKMLSLMDIEESTDVKTACVPIGGRPKIVLNPEYVTANCETDEKLYMLIQHELHHVLLGHTRLFKRTTPSTTSLLMRSSMPCCRAKPEPEWTALFEITMPMTSFQNACLDPLKTFQTKPYFQKGCQKMYARYRIDILQSSGTFWMCSHCW